MQNKIIVALVALITIVGLGFLIYDNARPKISDQFKHDEDTYIVYFYSPTCGACKAIEEDVEYFRENGTINLYKYDINTVSKTVLAKNRVEVTPTMLLVKNDRVVKRAVGIEQTQALMNDYK